MSNEYTPSYKMNKSTQVTLENGQISIAIPNTITSHNIDITQCDTHEKIVSIVSDLCKKTWVTREIIDDFIDISAHINGLKVHCSL
jgi:hypothetical protein